MNILLTGSSGFIGSNFLNSTQHNIRNVVRDKSCKLPNDFLINELSSETDWSNAFDCIDSVIHLAGLAHSNTFSDEDYYRVNFKGTQRLALEAANSGVKRFVFVSSILVNGSVTTLHPFHPESAPSPSNAFAKSKYDIEQELKSISQKTGLELVIVRPTLVYGPNAPGNFGLLTKLIRYSPFLPFGLAKNKRDFIAVQNLVDLLLTVAYHPKAPGHIFLASDGCSISIKEFTNAIANGLGTNLIQLPIPISFLHFVARLLGKPAITEQLLGNLYVDSSNANKILGWTPPYTMDQALFLLRNHEMS